MNHPQTLRPDRLRTIEKPFTPIPSRILKDGLFADQRSVQEVLSCSDE